MKKVIPSSKIFFSKLPSPSSWKFWFLLAFTIKGLFFILKTNETQPPNLLYQYTFAADDGDASSYIEPVENFIKTGSYFDDYRMPGYGWIYYLLRLIISQTIALNCLVILQLTLSSISVYILAKIALIIFKMNHHFYLTFFFYAISTFVSLFDHTLLTESFCTSSIILSTYFLIHPSQHKAHVLLSGLLLTWSIFLKPVMAPLLGLFILYIFFKDRNALKIKKYSRIKIIFLFILPFLLIDGAWMIRNYKVHGKVYPLTKSVYYTSIENSYVSSLFGFMNAFGGSIVFWQPESDIIFFKATPDITKHQKNVAPPANIYTSKFNYDSLLIIRDEIQKIENQNTSPTEKLKITLLVKKRLDDYATSIKKEKPFLFYVLSRLKVLKRFFIHSGTYNLFNKVSTELNFIELTIKIFYSILYGMVVLLGIIGGFILLFRSKITDNYFLLSGIGLYIAFVYPLILKMDEFRYFVPAYPFFLIYAIFASLIIFQSLKNKINA